MAAERLCFTGDEEADRFLVQEPFALLVGFALDQQVPVQRAFSAPLELSRRVGVSDAAAIARMDPAELERAFAQKPALHRFPRAMAERTHALAELVAERYEGDATRVWTEAADAADLERRLYELPGFGEMKVKSLLAVLAKQLGVRPAGIDEHLPAHRTLGDVDSPAALADYQATKRAAKAQSAAQRTP